MDELQEKSLDLLKEEQTKQIIPILSTTFEQILQLGLSLDLIYILEGFSQGIDVTTNINNAKAESWKQTLVRKGYIDESSGITKDGKELLLLIGQGKSSTLKSLKNSKRQVISSSFDLWWKAYPSSDNFIYRGKTFKGSRALRINRDQCILKFNKIIKEGEYKIEDMVAALELEKSLKMEESLRLNQNKMSYFQNSLTYLNQRTYEPFVELVKAGMKIEESKTLNRVDI